MANLYDKASLVMIPSGYKAGKLYSVKPDSGSGDFTVSRASIASRLNEDGLIENMAIDVPRLQYPSCPSVLLEDASTNLFVYDAAGGGWTLSGITTSGGWESPHVDFINSAFKVIPDAGISGKYIYQTLSFTINEEYSFSCYAKKNENKYVQLGFGTSGFGSLAYSNYDLETGEITFNGSSVTDSFIEEIGNGWFRIGITAECTTGGTTQVLMSAIDTPDATRNPNDIDGDGVSSIFIFGGQLEQFDSATSLIFDGTEGATLNRALDGCTLSDLQTNNILGASNWTVFMDIGRVSIPPANHAYIRLLESTTAKLYIYSRTSGYSALYDLVNTSFIDGTENFISTDGAKIAFSYDGTTINYAVNGVLSPAYTAVLPLGAISDLQLNQALVSQECNQIGMYNTTLTTDELIDLTT